MKKIIRHTFGGLSTHYYIRHLLFGSLMPVVAIIGIISSGALDTEPFKSNTLMHLVVIVMLIVNTLLYPYSRFVYESIIGFFVGGHRFYASGVFFIFALFIKIFTMVMCWGYAVFIAPFGLAYLYYRHSRTAS